MSFKVEEERKAVRARQKAGTAQSEASLQAETESKHTEVNRETELA